MSEPMTPPRPDGRFPEPVLARDGDPPTTWIGALGLGSPAAVVLVAGGDEPVDPALRPRLTQLLARGLLRTLRDLPGGRADARACCLVRAGGSGLPALLAQAAADGDGQVHLVGVAPAGLLAAAAGGGDAPVPGLTHLFGTPGRAWGDERASTFALAQALVAAGEPGNTPAAPQPLLLLMGGGAEALKAVLLAVRRGWPVLLVVGSGGAADDLARQLAVAAADGEDPDLAEILADGQFTLITLGPQAAGAVEALARAVQRACGRDSVLALAWQRFAALDLAAAQQQQDFGLLQGWILLFGVLAVALSVLHSVASAQHWDGAVVSLRYALIVVPIGVSTLVLVANRYAPGKRWVLLRAAAEALKRDIYRYRVRPPHAMVDGAREKRLQQAMEDITRRLARTEVNTMGLPPWSGPLPPPDAVAPGDDGLSLLPTDRYLRLRLADQLAFYGKKTARLARQSSRWQLVAIVVGALGSLLAALGDGAVAWVALTSAVASALLAYLGYKQFDTTLVSYNQTATDLQNLQAWWTALLPDEQALPENVDKLVSTTEGVLATEQDGWAQNMTNALAALRAQQDPPDKPTSEGPKA